MENQKHPTRRMKNQAADKKNEEIFHCGVSRRKGNKIGKSWKKKGKKKGNRKATKASASVPEDTSRFLSPASRAASS